MTDLTNLKAPKGANRKRKRVGRGHGSTLGKTAGKGQKGQKARSGGSVHARFEGGQTPLHRRLPKVGFSNPFEKHYTIINLQDLERVFEDGETVDLDSLRSKGLVKRNLDGVKILGNGELTKKLSVKATKFSKSAKAAIEGVGGSVEVI
ncbi:50S ribosomal protein L15 [Bradymonadaceae bacterium TMQ3]|uniref:Large ribosomal subunit protein uL15 n=1 Tax=Lujinxingia sediminis TaxID=2480984 RepID=A0ABY0CP77_9DELT|nr:50S ribosomal protein L15 [Lujinxingia sediminis]RDV38063.1 50S ribosomal protein L15 [Bradymonadaceae bacterium TMQ3]RVU42268.1 50S ribosomal protein L15 [Lujinxingia sediminis]TXC75733.1 50S ribosomal protein L15 [Bradymonadales bacterium TMQ1]